MGGTIFLVFFALPFLLAYWMSVYTSKRIYLSVNNLPLAILFSGSLFVVIFYAIEKVVVIGVALLFGSLGELFGYIAGSVLSDITFGHPEIIPIAFYVLGIVLVALRLRMQRRQITAALVSTGVSGQQVPQRALYVQLFWLLPIVAVLILGRNFEDLALQLRAQIGAPLLHHPEWCRSLQGTGSLGTDYELIANCVQKSIPPNKTLSDYCDDLPYAPGGALAERGLDQSSCLIKKQVATNDAATCVDLKDQDPHLTLYIGCISKFPNSPEYRAYCTDLEQKRDFYIMMKIGCITDANINVKNAEGRTALFFSSGNFDYQAILFPHNPDVNIRDNAGETPLIHYMLYQQNPDITVVENFLKRGAKTNVSDFVGNTPLIIAVKGWDTINLIKLLIQYGADIHFKNTKGESACSIADALRDSEPSPWNDYINSLCYSS